MNDSVEFQTLPASPTSIADLQLALTSPPRIVDVIVRSAVATPLQGTQVLLLPGKHQIRNINDPSPWPYMRHRQRHEPLASMRGGNRAR